jgi:flagellar FliL protein
LFKKKPKDAPAEDAEGAEEAPTEEGAKKKPPLMILLIAGAGLLIVLGGGGAAALFLMKPADPAAAQKAARAAKDKDKEKDKKKGPPPTDVGQVRDGPNGVSYYTLPDLVVNMDTADGKPTFLKLKLTFEISDPETVDLVQQDAPRLQDMFTAFLRELRPEDLAGSQGTYQLKAEILRRVNMVIAPKRIDSVLVEEMLVQ